MPLEEIAKYKFQIPVLWLLPSIGIWNFSFLELPDEIPNPISLVCYLNGIWNFFFGTYLMKSQIPSL
jgi:hypothetical protein